MLLSLLWCSVAWAVDLKKSMRKRIGDQPPTQRRLWGEYTQELLDLKAITREMSRQTGEPANILIYEVS